MSLTCWSTLLIATRFSKFSHFVNAFFTGGLFLYINFSCYHVVLIGFDVTVSQLSYLSIYLHTNYSSFSAVHEINDIHQIENFHSVLCGLTIEQTEATVVLQLHLWLSRLA